MKQEIKPINKRISAYRKLAGYTQQTAAEALGIKKNTYARMELHGNPTPDMLVRIAELYNISPNLILFGTKKNEITETIASRTTEEKRLHDDPPLFKRRPELVLTVNEENCIKACRQLSKAQQKEVMALINKFYNESK